jgi:glycosyltransferase involved in cell wall biosynthesis
MDENIQVSIIIPSYNDLNGLQKALQSVEAIDYPVENFEVIVADDGSQDGTGEYVRQLIGQTKINLRYLYQDNRGPAAARNIGIRQARGKYLLFIDSDCFADSQILRHYLKHFPDERVGGVGGNVIPRVRNIITEYLEYTGGWKPGIRHGEIVYLVTANAFFPKKALVKAGYFDDAFRRPGGEEPELCYRMLKTGCHFKYEKDAIVIHSHSPTLKSMLKMYFAYGKGRAIFVKKWPEATDWLYPISFSAFCRRILGVDAFKRFIFDFGRNLSLRKAAVFFVLEYARIIASFRGYRTVIKRGTLI